jgi:hypothetical protein
MSHAEISEKRLPHCLWLQGYLMDHKPSREQYQTSGKFKAIHTKFADQLLNAHSTKAKITQKEIFGAKRKLSSPDGWEPPSLKQQLELKIKCKNNCIQKI